MPNWPPVGYSDPKEFPEVKETHVYTLMTLLIAVLLPLLHPYIYPGIDAYTKYILSVSQSIFLSERLLIAAGATLIAVLAIFVYWKQAVTPVHERIHYEVAKYFGNNPEYTSVEGLVFQNPAVIALDTNITRYGASATLLAPLMIIGVVTLAGGVIFSGVVSAIFYLTFLMNTAGSGQDIYLFTKLVMFPRGTEFANFKRNGDIHTEYVVPDK